MAAATTTRKDAAETSTETSTDDSHVFGMRAAEQLAQSFTAIAHAQGRFSEELFSDSSEQKLFPTDNSTLDTTHSGEGNVVVRNLKSQDQHCRNQHIGSGHHPKQRPAR